MKALLLLILVIATRFSVCQEIAEKKGYKYNNNFDLALSTNSTQQTGALSWVHLHSLTKKKRFKIGYGLRFTSQIGKDLTYTTAPAKLVAQQTGPQVLFSKKYLENVDTFNVANSNHNMLNVSINIQYTIKEKLDIGFNIDASGFTFGKKVNGAYQSYQDTKNVSSQPAQPTSLNALLVGENDNGSLNSELYLRYWLCEKWGVKAGITYLFTEYTTENKLRLDNDRWRNKSVLGMITISYSPFR